MKMYLISFVTSLLVLKAIAYRDLPTNYEYYTSSGVTSGITTNETSFFLNGKPFSIYSGSFHYFRTPRAYWRTRLAQIRAAGLNTVETYIPWNLHEPRTGRYDFGSGGSEMEDFLHLEEFLKLAKEEDLFVILRPGPYICSEYNFGGFPSWLLREKTMGFRTDEENYIKFVKRYFNVLLPILQRHQITKNGPVIAFQIENEYGSTGYNSFNPSKNYLNILRQLYLDNDIVELLVTSDNAGGQDGNLPGVLFQTLNTGNPINDLEILKRLQPNKPFMVMEFWVGWFDYWTSPHSTKKASHIRRDFEVILKYPASVNMYMFVGGSNFAFGNGAILTNVLLDNSGFLPVTTSYDYDAPISEAGDYTQKYNDIRDLLNQYNPVKTHNPDPPKILPRIAYPSIKITKQIKLSDVVTNDPPFIIWGPDLDPMENMIINVDSGQSNGYIVYRQENVDLEAGTVLKIGGHVCDTVMVLVNGELVSPKLQSFSDLDGFGYWKLKDSSLVINKEAIKGATIDLVVEEWGRMHGGHIYQYNQTFKGLWQDYVYLNDKKIEEEWMMVPLEFTKRWTTQLSIWEPKSSNDGTGLYQAKLNIDGEPRDTYIDMRNWSKGLVIVNGFPLGKYFRPGPQQAIYVPAPFLKKGENEIVIFEHFTAGDEIRFVTDQVYENW